MDEWINKIWIYILEYYSVMKSKEKSDTCYNIVDHSVQLSRLVVSESLQPHGLQHTRLPCPPPNPGAYSNSCPSSWWCYPTISSSVIPFSSHLHSFPASGLFKWVSSSHQVFKVLSFSFSISPSMNIQDWRKEEKLKAKEKRKDIPIWMQSSKE